MPAKFSIYLFLFISVLPTRAQLQESWDLSTFFGQDGDWKPTTTIITMKLDSLNSLSLKEITSKNELLNFLKVSRQLRSGTSKLLIYGILRSGANVNDPEAKEIYEIATSLESQIESVLGVYENSVISLPDSTLTSWSEGEEFTVFRRRLNRISKAKKYALNGEATKVLNSVKLLPRNSVDIFWALHGADLNWPEMVLNKDTIIVNQQSYVNIGNTKDISKRNNSIKELLLLLEKYEAVFGQLYYNRVQGDYILAKNQGFSCGMEAEWYKRDHIPKEGYENMIKSLRKNKGVLNRYIALKADILGREMTYPDLFTTVNLPEQDYHLNNSLGLVKKIAENYHETLYSRIEKVLNQPWSNIAYSDTKENTYSIYPPVAGNPNFLFNYQPTHKHARALMGAYTLMAIWTDLPENALPENGDDPAVYANGIIYLGDIMYDEYVINNLSESIRERKLALINALDFYWYYAIRWMIFTELDMFVEEQLINNRYVTGNDISEKYLTLLREYFGAHINVEDHFGKEWMLTHIVFMSYEHQYWPASMAFASHLLEMSKSNPEIVSGILFEAPANTNYDRSYDILKAVGLDLTDLKVYESMFRRMNLYIDELEMIK